MAVRFGLGALGLFYLGNAVWMIVVPNGWYGAVPGVSGTGPMNMHFIIDIGLAFLASGSGLVWGSFRAGAVAATLALAGATWPALHALFHIWLWLAHGLPRAPDALAGEAFGVVAVAALGIWLATVNAQREGAR